ncbi:prephenate/arogenate dehydrogenase [Vulcanococcus sp.]|jgi:arogenate dehydrogenase (NADP+)|uniref:prephenate/arogenate dehydrogenase n=1 Tax=Vulcanococcus sp. TaxID=2856995 RepID=UPI0037DA739E
MTTSWCDRPVGIVGLGLIGGSLGLDLRQQGLEVRALVHRSSTAERARQRGLADQVDTDPGVLQPCGLIVLALPLDRLLDPPSGLREALPAQAVITDVGSVKAPVVERWQRWHPRFVASHPMAGTADSGVEAGITGLFAGRPWVATPTADTNADALEQVRQLAQRVGAQWLSCDPQQHDRAVALISHMPVLVSAALLEAADGEADGGTAALAKQLASSGFADTSRIGGGNPELGTLMARSNRAAVLAALGRYRQRLEGLEQLVQQERWEELEGRLSRCQERRPDFL